MIQKITENTYAIDFQNFGSTVYLIKISNKNILIDTSSKENSQELINYLSSLNIEPKDVQVIILTHTHYDHIENIKLFKNAKIYGNFKTKINRNNSQTEIPNILSIKNQPIKEFQIYETPGHTQGDIIILYENILFSGDVIFHGGYIGRTDFPESDEKKMQKSLEFIKTLKFNILCPGH